MLVAVLVPALVLVLVLDCLTEKSSNSNEPSSVMACASTTPANSAKSLHLNGIAPCPAVRMLAF